MGPCYPPTDPVPRRGTIVGVSKLKRIARAAAPRILLVLGSVLVTLLLAELVARFAISDEIEAFFTPFEHDDSAYTVMVKDPTLLYTLAWYKPGATGLTGSKPVKINNLGLRDEQDYPMAKPAGCFRVLGLGDSMTFGKGVREAETFLAVLERQLRRDHPDRCIEILNAGMPNTNFYVQYLHYKLQWHRFKPDLVLVNFFAYNDTQLQDEEEPYSLGWMEFIDRHRWLKSFALVRWGYYRAFFTMGKKALDKGLPRYYDPDYPGWQQFRESVAKLKALTASNKARLVFTLIPIPEGYNDYPFASYHDTVIRFLTMEHRIPTFDTVKGLGGIDARKHWVHPSDGHPDPFVHEQIAIYMREVMPWSRWIAAAAAPPAEPKAAAP